MGKENMRCQTAGIQMTMGGPSGGFPISGQSSRTSGAPRAKDMVLCTLGTRHGRRDVCCCRCRPAFIWNAGLVNMGWQGGTCCWLLRIAEQAPGSQWTTSGVREAGDSSVSAVDCCSVPGGHGGVGVILGGNRLRKVQLAGAVYSNAHVV